MNNEPISILTKPPVANPIVKRALLERESKFFKPGNTGGKLTTVDNELANKFLTVRGMVVLAPHNIIFQITVTKVVKVPMRRCPPSAGS